MPYFIASKKLYSQLIFWSSVTIIGTVLPSLALSSSPQQESRQETLKDTKPGSIRGKAHHRLNSLQLEGKTIGRINIHVKNIFDLSKPKEDNILFRFANRFHIKTLDEVIRNSLLFEHGQPLNWAIIKETERSLRSYSFLYDASIKVTPSNADSVEVDVTTYDLWTLTGGINFTRKGGENEYGFQVVENNLLGQGKRIKFRRDANVDRVENLLHYADPFLFGSRNILALTIGKNSDGYFREFSLQQPFYALGAPKAYGLSFKNNEQNEALYYNNKKISAFTHSEKFIEFFGGISKGWFNHKTAQWTIGISHQKDAFTAVPIPNTAAMAAPLSRKLTYPWIAINRITDQYIKTHRINRIKSTEDINLGHEYQFRMGISHTGIGSDKSAFILKSFYKDWQRWDRDLLTYSSNTLEGRFQQKNSSHVVFNTTNRLFYSFSKRQVLYAQFLFEAAHNQDQDQQLLLGGESGLRGYPIRFQSGDRKLLASLEHRLYSDMHLWQLAHVGAAVFFDIGRTWSKENQQLSDSPILRDIGIGLRITSSRAAKGKVLHIDFAHAIDHNQNIDEYQLLLSTESRF